MSCGYCSCSVPCNSLCHNHKWTRIRRPMPTQWPAASEKFAYGYLHLAYMKAHADALSRCQGRFLAEVLTPPCIDLAIRSVYRTGCTAPAFSSQNSCTTVNELFMQWSTGPAHHARQIYRPSQILHQSCHQPCPDLLMRLMDSHLSTCMSMCTRAQPVSATRLQFQLETIHIHLNRFG